MKKVIATQNELIEISISAKGFVITDRLINTKIFESNDMRVIYGVTALHGYLEYFSEIDMSYFKLNLFNKPALSKINIELYKMFQNEHIIHGSISENFDTNAPTKHTGYIISRVHNDYIKSVCFYGNLFNRLGNDLSAPFLNFLKKNNLTESDFIKHGLYCKDGIVADMISCYILPKLEKLNYVFSY
jgi:hypothetical protein